MALAAAVPALDAEDREDLEDAPDHEIEAAEEEILDQATAARTIAQLKAEIATLQRLESLGVTVRRSGEDRKWRELVRLLAVATILSQMVLDGRMVTMDALLPQHWVAQTVGVIASDGVGQVCLRNSPETAILHAPRR